MNARHLKVRDLRHLVDSPPLVPDAAPPATPRDSPAQATRASLAAVVMANSVEGPAPQPSKHPAGSEVEAAAAKEDRRSCEPVPKKRRLLQATEAEQAASTKSDREDILAQALIAVGIDSNLVESEVEDLPSSHQGEGVAGLQYPKEVRPLPPGIPPPPRLRVPDPRVRPGFPPYQMEGPYVVRGIRHPYPPYVPMPPDLMPPHYRPVSAYPPHHYPRLPPPPPQTVGRLPMVRPPERHLHPPHGSPTMTRHFRPPPLHTSPPGPPPMHQPHEVHHVLAAPPSHPALPGSGPESPTRLYPSGPLGRPDLKDSHLREMYVPVLPVAGAPYPNLRPRIPEGFPRLPYDPRAVSGREVAPHQVMVAPHVPSGSPLPPRPGYSPERLPGTESPWRSQPVGEDARRPSRRVTEPPAPCVELIPIGPFRPSTVTTSSLEDGRGSDSDNQPSATRLTESKSQTGGAEFRRQSDPVLSNQSLRPPYTRRSLSSDPPIGSLVPATPPVEARRSSDSVVTNIITGGDVHKDGDALSKRHKGTTETSEEEPRPSSTNSDITIEKVVYVGPDGGDVTPHGGQPIPCNDADPVPLPCPSTLRSASEPPSSTMPPSATGKRPASVPAPGTTSGPYSQSAVSKDVAFMERLQLVLSDLVSVPGATQLQELSRSPERLLSTLVRRWGVQPSTDPDFQKRLREDFKTMVQLCMPPTLLQDFGWESCSSEEILTQLIQLSHNGEGDVQRRSSMSSCAPLDEPLEDDVFSPSTPQLPNPAPQPSQSPSPSSQPFQLTTQTSQPSQSLPQTARSFHPPPLTSQPPPLTSQPPQPPPLISQPSQSILQTSQSPQPSLQTSKPTQRLPQDFPPPQSPTQISQPSQSTSKTSKPSQPPPQASKPSHSPPQTSQSSQLRPPVSQPSQTRQPASESTQSRLPASQSTQSRSLSLSTYR